MQTEGKCHNKDVKDLWIHNETFNGPATHLANGEGCSEKTQNPDNETCVYEESLLIDGVKSVIGGYGKDANKKKNDDEAGEREREESDELKNSVWALLKRNKNQRYGLLPS